MITLDYVVRESAGVSNRGTIAGEAMNGAIVIGDAREVSLNLSSGQIAQYVRKGGNLELILTDGSVVTLEGFYAGPEAALYLSDAGALNKVILPEMPADGPIEPSYAFVETGGDKWGPYDELVFLDLDRIEPVVAPILAAPSLFGLWPAAAAVAGVGLIGGGGDGAPAAIDPTVNGGDVVVVGDADGNPAAPVEVTGTAEPGSEVEVTLGDSTTVVAPGSDGNWVAVFEPDALPDDGGYNVVVVITEPDGDVIDLVGPSVLIDTTAPDLTVESGLASNNHVVNGADYADGTDITGRGEPGASVVITIGDVSRETTVAADGSWSFSFAPGELPDGEYTQAVTFVTTDIYGNAATFTDAIVVDTVPGPIDVNVVAGDDVINAAEVAGGLAVSGTSEPGSTVVIELAGASQTTTVAGNGTWSVTFAAADLAPGEYDAEITATTTDAAGNSAATTHGVHVDTQSLLTIGQPVEGDNIINMAERADGLVLTGTTQPGSSVSVTFAGMTRAATVDGNGGWSVSYASGEIQPGEYDATITAVSSDAAGNQATATHMVRVDTEAGALALGPNPIEGDDIINLVERADGVEISGTATPGLPVAVTLAGVTHTVTSSPNGTWSSIFTPAELPQGTYQAEIRATITDPAGNTRTVTDAVQVDTEVLNFANLSAPVEGDGIVNAAEAQDGIVLHGTVEPGSQVAVQLGAVSRAAFVDGAGNWTVTFAAADIPAGEYDAAVTATATDPAGNVLALSDTIRVDTLVNELALSGQIEGDGILNAAERDAGLTLNGTVEPGATVAVTVAGVTHAAAVDGAGNWTVNFAASEVAAGEYQASAVINAVDAAGNTRSLTEVFTVDTHADAPLITAYERGLTGVRGINTADAADVDSFHIQRIDADGNVSDVSFTAKDNPAFGEVEFDFNAPIPDGSHLVVTAQDNAGNETGTLFVLDETTTSVVDLSNPGLAGFQIEAVDLQFAEDSRLTLDAATLKGLSDHSDKLVIHGDVDDQVTMTGAVATGEHVSIAGQDYDVYSLGDTGRVVVDDDINTVI